MLRIPYWIYGEQRLKRRHRARVKSTERPPIFRKPPGVEGSLQRLPIEVRPPSGQLHLYNASLCERMGARISSERTLLLGDDSRPESLSLILASSYTPDSLRNEDNQTPKSHLIHSHWLFAHFKYLHHLFWRCQRNRIRLSIWILERLRCQQVELFRSRHTDFT